MKQTDKTKIMNEQFLNYKQSLLIKEFGFDEDCLARYEGKLNAYGEKPLVFEFTFANEPSSFNKVGYPDYPYKDVEAPLKSQFFRWVRDKYGIRTRNYGMLNFSGEVSEYFEIFEYAKGTTDKVLSVVVGALDYEKAEDACINVIIEQIKQK